MQQVEKFRLDIKIEVEIKIKKKNDCLRNLGLSRSLALIVSLKGLLSLSALSAV
jgi:hypothetical protein